MPTRAGFCVVPGSEKAALPGATVVGGPGTNSYLYYSYTNPSFTYDDFLAMNTTYDPAVDHTMGVYFTSEFGGTVLWNSGF